MRTPLRLLARGCILGCLLVTPFTLTACGGFTPLYAQQGLTSSLSQIDIETPQTRTGYFLEQKLRNSLGGDAGKQKLYTLTIDLKEQHYQVGYRVDDTSTRSELTDNVSFILKDRSGKVLLTDSFTETVTYSTSSSPFTGIVSQQNAQQRVATSAAQKIQTSLALYFHDAK